MSLSTKDETSPIVLCNTFPKFSSLPLELRDLVWKYALPEPRLVYISFTEVKDEGPEDREQEDEEVDGVGTEDVNMSDGEAAVDELEYIHGWRINKNAGYGYDARITFQTQLEDYGFLSSRRRDALPPQRGATIFTANNRAQFSISSPTPTPALIHTCRESAAFVKNQGWVRALGTPVSQPIWINFQLDILYLGLHIPYDEEKFREGVSYFHASDLLRIKHLALPWLSDDYFPYGVMYWRRAAILIPNFLRLESCTYVVYDHESNRRDMSLKLLGKPVPDPKTTIDLDASWNDWGIYFRMRESTYEGIVERIFEALHMLKKHDCHRARLRYYGSSHPGECPWWECHSSLRADWKIPAIRLGIMVNALTLKCEVPAPQPRSRTCFQEHDYPFNSECVGPHILELQE